MPERGARSGQGDVNGGANVAGGPARSVDDREEENRSRIGGTRRRSNYAKGILFLGSATNMPTLRGGVRQYGYQ